MFTHVGIMLRQYIRKFYSRAEKSLARQVFRDGFDYHRRIAALRNLTLIMYLMILFILAFRDDASIYYCIAALSTLTLGWILVIIGEYILMLHNEDDHLFDIFVQTSVGAILLDLGGIFGLKIIGGSTLFVLVYSLIQFIFLVELMRWYVALIISTHSFFFYIRISSDPTRPMLEAAVCHNQDICATDSAFWPPFVCHLWLLNSSWPTVHELPWWISMKLSQEDHIVPPA
jgi:hypothetical protein